MINDKKIRELENMIKKMEEKLHALKKDGVVPSEPDEIVIGDDNVFEHNIIREKHLKEPNKHPLPPHLHENLGIDFRKNRLLLERVFGDPETVRAVIESVQKSPVEIKAVLKLIIDLHERIDEILGE